LAIDLTLILLSRRSSHRHHYTLSIHPPLAKNIRPDPESRIELLHDRTPFRRQDEHNAVPYEDANFAAGSERLGEEASTEDPCEEGAADFKRMREEMKVLMDVSVVSSTWNSWSESRSCADDFGGKIIYLTANLPMTTS
jgi:hypothetical protein